MAGPTSSRQRICRARRNDTSAPLAALLLATYQLSGAYGSATITLQRAGPKAFSALIAGASGRVCGEVLGCSGAASAHRHAQHSLIGDIAGVVG